ncbi:hypothetical protein ACU6U9_02810 [Pseudomonas sp. HK3]
MIFFIENNNVTGFQEYPDSTTKPHILIHDRSVINPLKNLLGYVQLDENNQLPPNWYEDALLLKNAELIESTYRSKLTEVHSNADAFTTEYLQRYSSVEKETWSTQTQ